ncbi:MAG: sulfite exporter TauE/SafE family protein, partial [Bacteroidia bacterium]|nr:sulfite exporter TauE/SafE family protein [Bacteroidia bacterium]
VNKKLFRKLLIPGILGAAAGAALISFISKDSIAFVKPLVSIYTLLLGISIILKAVNFVFIKKKFKAVVPLAAAGGFLDSVGGGGWGPIVTATLVAGGRNFRSAVGSSHLAKFFVAIVSTVTFVSIIGLGHWKIIFGLVVGGMIVAPFSIYLSNKIPVKKGLILVGIVVIIVSVRNLILIFTK